MHHILLIDDEPGVVASLTRLLRHTPLVVGGVVAHATVEGFVSARQALARASEHAYDLAVCDYRMPGMNGVELLSEVMRRRPQTSRIVLSGYADQQMVLKSLGAAHQYLTAGGLPGFPTDRQPSAEELAQLENTGKRVISAFTQA